MSEENNYKRRIGTFRFISWDEQEAYDIERIKEAILSSDMEKFRNFTRLMRIGMMLKKAKISHYEERRSKGSKKTSNSPE
jgi:hypothetical protein